MLRKTSLVFGSMLSCVLMVGAAQAVPITPGPTFDFPIGTVYNASPDAADIGNGAFSFDYFINVVSDSTAQVFASSHQPFPTAGQPQVANLTLTWLDASLNPLPGGSLLVTNAAGTTVGGSLVINLLAGVDSAFDYVLRVTGIAANDGRYDFDLNEISPPSDVPLPSTLFLFGTTVLGGIALLRRRRGAWPRIASTS
jgi:hypothetical protein